MAHNYTELYADKWSADMLQDADDAVTKCELWDWLKNVPTPTKEDEGFMFSVDPNIMKIDKEMKLYDYHSGSSYGWTMRQMEYIAKNGWESFRDLRLKRMEERKKKEVTPLTVAEAYRNILPDGEQQYQGMKAFSEGKLSYAEMRRLCG